jgi:hypothetical protein
MDNDVLNDNMSEYIIFNNGTFFIGYVEDNYYDGIITFDNGDYFIGKCVDKTAHVHFVTGKLYDSDGCLLRHYDDNVELEFEFDHEIINTNTIGVIIHSESDKPSLIIYQDGTVFYGDVVNNAPVDGVLTLADGKYFEGSLIDGKVKFKSGKVFFNNGSQYCFIYNTKPIHILTEEGPNKKDMVH